MQTHLKGRLPKSSASCAQKLGLTVCFRESLDFPIPDDREESGYILIACLEFSGVEFLKKALTDPLLAEGKSNGERNA